jgi:uncharacterized protein
VTLVLGVVSVPSNIAEGKGQSSDREFLQFLNHARGSLYELQTQIKIAHRLAYMDTVSTNTLASQAAEVGRVLHGLIRAFRNRFRPPDGKSWIEAQSLAPKAQSRPVPETPPPVTILALLFTKLGAIPLMSATQASSTRTRVVREADRAVYDREAVYRILDEAFICHVGFNVDGQPFVIPTSFGRSENSLYIHGSAASRMLRNLDEGIPVCVTVTLLDGLVLARSIFNHSMNYRSVVVLGTATLVQDPVEKLEALRLLSEHILPGRWVESRQPNEKELKATFVLRVPIEEFSAKVRQGPAIDDEEDYSFRTWAGVLPLTTVPGAPERDARCDPGIPVPAYVGGYTRKRG